MKRLTATLISKEQLSKRVLFLTFKLSEEVSFVSGQFFTFFIPQGDKKLPRSYSVSNPTSTTDTVSFGIKLIGGGLASTVFTNAEINDEFSLMGPFGEFIYRETDTKKQVFIATDTGVMPFYSILQDISLNKPTTLLLGSRTKDEILFNEFFSRLDNNNDLFTFAPTLTREEGDSWQGLRGRVQDNLPEDLSDTTFYICGSKEMVVHTIEALESKGVSKEHIRFERYN